MYNRYAPQQLLSYQCHSALTNTVLWFSLSFLPPGGKFTENSEALIPATLLLLLLLLLLLAEGVSSHGGERRKGFQPPVSCF